MIIYTNQIDSNAISIQILKNIFDTDNLKSFPNIKYVNTNSIVEIIKQDEALGFTTQEFVKEELNDKKIAIVKTNFDIPTSEYGIYYNKNNHFTSLDNLIECIKKCKI